MEKETKENIKELYKKTNIIQNEEYANSDTLIKEISLYVHIPFCERKCNYCSFISFCNKFDKIEEYVNALLNELQLRKIDNAILKTIYIGGGTPSLLNINQVEKLVNGIKNIYTLKDNLEFTIEVNPNSITKEKLQTYKKLGINRISIGIQSLNDKKLKLLGRLHNSQVALDAVKLVKGCGFNNINCDFIINLPNQTLFEVKREIKKLSKIVTHFSIYSLSVEENTPFFDMYNSGMLKLPNENKSASLYSKTVKYLSKLKFDRYEVSNFSKQGFSSIHNKTYWEMGEYLGVGVASHSFLNGKRIANTENLETYLSSLDKLILPNKEEIVSKENLIEETIMLGLRESQGFNFKKLKTQFNYDIIKEKKNNIALLKQLGLIKVDGDYLKATDKGFLVLNQIILKLI